MKHKNNDTTFTATPFVWTVEDERQLKEQKKADRNALIFAAVMWISGFISALCLFGLLR